VGGWCTGQPGTIGTTVICRLDTPAGASLIDSTRTVRGIAGEAVQISAGVCCADIPDTNAPITASTENATNPRRRVSSLERSMTSPSFRRNRAAIIRRVRFQRFPCYNPSVYQSCIERERENSFWEWMLKVGTERGGAGRRKKETGYLFRK
jgi:hypothetical protein